MKRIAIIATILLLLLASGCKSTRSTKKTSSTSKTTVVTKPKTKDAKEVLFENMIDAYGSWETAVVKGSVSLGSLSSSFEMRMIKDEAIQISLRPIFGIEVGRLLIKDDKIYIFNKINNQYIENSLKDFSDKLPFEPTVSDLQNILLGRPFILGTNSLTAKDYKKFSITTAGKNDWRMQPKKQADKIEYLFALNGEEIECLQASQTNIKRKVICNYQDYQHDFERLYPSSLQIDAQNSNKKYSFSLDYTSISWDRSTTIQPLSTKGYSRTTLSKMFDSLLK